MTNTAAKTKTAKIAKSPKTEKPAKKTVANVANETPVVATTSGVQLTKRTNIPWRRKFYFLDADKYAETEEDRKKVASQIQLMLKYMAENGLTSVESSQDGTHICTGAVDKGYVKTKINPPVLFAYYRKDMEKFGLTFAGYNVNAA